MTAKLYKQVAARNLVISRRAGVTGEVCIKFRNPNIKSITLSTNQPLDVFANNKKLTSEDVLTSNMVDLIVNGFLTIVY
jgi:hypothetical protein